MRLGSTRDRSDFSQRYDKLWQKYNRKICSGKGLCQTQSDTKMDAVCVCDPHYNGTHCESQQGDKS